MVDVLLMQALLRAVPGKFICRLAENSATNLGRAL